MYKKYNTKEKDVWLQSGVLQVMVVRRKNEKRSCGNTGSRRSVGRCDTGRKGKLMNNEDKDCHGKECWEYIFSVCTTSR